MRYECEWGARQRVQKKSRKKNVFLRRFAGLQNLDNEKRIAAMAFLKNYYPICIIIIIIIMKNASQSSTNTSKV